MYVFIRSGVLLWREVWSKLFKLTRTFFFLSFRSGTLSSEALHPPTLLPHPPLHFPSGGFTILVSITLLLSTSALPSLSLSLHVAFCCAVSAPFSPSHCPVTRCRIRDCDAFSIIFAADDLTTLWSTRWNIDLSHIVIFEAAEWWWDKRERQERRRGVGR